MCGGSRIKNPEVSSDSGAGTVRREVVFAADLGGTHLRAATVDENGTIHFRLKQKTPHTANPDDIVRALVQAVRQCETQSKTRGDGIRAVSVSVPGSDKVDRALVVSASYTSGRDAFRLTAAS